MAHLFYPESLETSATCTMGEEENERGEKERERERERKKVEDDGRRGWYYGRKSKAAGFNVKKPGGEKSLVSELAVAI